MSDKQAQRRAAKIVDKIAKRGRVPTLRRDHKRGTITTEQDGRTRKTLIAIPDTFIGLGWKPDADGSGVVGVGDLVWVETHWGQPDGFGGTVAVNHLLAVITNWEVTATNEPGGTMIAPLVDRPVMNVIGESIESEGNCITRNNGGHCTIELDDASLVSRSGYCIYADSSDYTRIKNNSRLEAKNYYVLRGTHTRMEIDDSKFIAPHHSFRPYAWKRGWSRNSVYMVEYMRLGGGAANEWENPVDTGGTPDAPIRFEGDKIQASMQVTFYSATHDFEFIDCDFAGTRKLFIDSGAKGLKFIRPKNMPPVDTKGATASQLAARNIVGI